MSLPPLVVGLIGVTNVGKSTLLDHLRASGDQRYGFIEVGKELRRRYPPEFFNGQGAMKETEREVWQIWDEQYYHAAFQGAEIILSDGQPRMAEHVGCMRSRVGAFPLLQLHAPLPLLQSRAALRDSTPEARQLSQQRLTNDYRQLYEVLSEYAYHIHSAPLVIKTDEPNWLDTAESALLVMRTNQGGPANH